MQRAKLKRGFHYTDEIIITEKQRKLLITYLRETIKSTLSDDELISSVLSAKKADYTSPEEAWENLLDEAIFFYGEDLRFLSHI